ncbi:hypothetical protein HDU76_008040, partial [Blyttiomyces sp. JEL0837]
MTDELDMEAIVDAAAYASAAELEKTEEGGLTVSYFVERDDALMLVQKVMDGVKENYERLKASDETDLKWVNENMKMFHMLLLINNIFVKYQEQPNLLDSHLETFVCPSVNILRSCMHELALMNVSLEKQTAFVTILHPLFYFLYLLSKVRGYKTVLKFFTHEAADLEPTFKYLLFVPQRSYSWETRYMLLLWLSLIIIIPFDLKVVDSGHSYKVTPDGPELGLIESILEKSKDYLMFAGKEHEGASILLTRLLTRKDTLEAYLKPFMNWGIAKALEPVEGFSSTFLIRGVMLALCTIHKHGPREALLPTLGSVLSLCVSLHENDAVKGSSLLRKLVLKLIQRVGLCYMKPQLAPWRYQRGTRNLSVNLSKSTGGDSSAVVGSVVSSAESAANMEEDDSVPSEVEEVIGILLDGLRDKDTIVRWSAAKGIGRVSSRLPKHFANEVVSSVISLFAEDTLPDGEDVDITAVSENSWHGACLAVAELARRGLLMPDLLTEVMPWIKRSLLFDLRRGTHSVGIQVRDAACYVCWSFARAYDSKDLVSHITTIAQSLVVTAVLDREVNVRRAASAAFQESVGRLGSGGGAIPHGIEIVTLADYFNIGNQTGAYLDVATSISKLEEYRPSIITHAGLVTIFHWD